MANPNSAYGDILATTVQLLQDDIVDNITNNNALLYHLKEKGQVQEFDGGPAIVQPIEYSENVTYQRISGYEQFDITPSTPFTAASFPIKQVVLTVSASGLEILQNSGKSQKRDLMKARVKNAMHTFENNFSTDLYSDGTASGGKQIGGLQLLLADDETAGVVGGISRVTWEFWRHQQVDMSVDIGAEADLTNIQSGMNTLWLKCVTRKRKPSLIVTDNNFFKLFEESLTATQRITAADNKMAKAGFESYAYKSVPVVFDGGLGGACPANHMYFINGDTMLLRPHKDRNLEMLDPERHAVNQDAVVKVIGWAGNLTVSGPRYNGVLIN